MPAPRKRFLPVYGVPRKQNRGITGLSAVWFGSGLVIGAVAGAVAAVALKSPGGIRTAVGVSAPDVASRLVENQPLVLMGLVVCGLTFGLIGCLLRLRLARDCERQMADRLHRTMSEMDHRIRNNLQIVTALIQLQMDEQQGTGRKSLEAVASQVRAVSAVHSLREQTPLEIVSSRVLLHRLQDVFRLDGIELRFTTDDLPLSVKQATSIALILNEVIALERFQRHDTVDVQLNHCLKPLPVRKARLFVAFTGTEKENAACDDVHELLITMLIHHDLSGDAVELKVDEGCIDVQFPLEDQEQTKDLVRNKGFVSTEPSTTPFRRTRQVRQVLSG